MVVYEQKIVRVQIPAVGTRATIGLWRLASHETKKALFRSILYRSLQQQKCGSHTHTDINQITHVVSWHQVTGLQGSSVTMMDRSPM
jgi:hypothetical protein